MTEPEDRGVDDDVSLAELLQPIVRSRVSIAMTTIVVTLLAALVAVAYFVRQPAVHSGAVGFRPAFSGVESGKYPNGAPFAASDIVDASIVDRVVANDNLQVYCAAAVFRSGLAVIESSPALEFLNLEVQARLSDAKLTVADRKSIQDDYATRRAALPSQFELRYLEPATCAPVPDPVLAKALTDVLETWAADGQSRGLLQPGSMTLPAIFDQLRAENRNVLVRAELMRNYVTRITANIRQVEALPTWDALTNTAISTKAVRRELEELSKTRLDPLILEASRGLGRAWLEETRQSVKTETIQLEAARQRADAYSRVLREYSGGTTGANAGTSRSQSPSEQPSGILLDRALLDKIVDLSTNSVQFRQEMTRKLLEATLDAVNHATALMTYNDALASFSQSAGDHLTPDAMNKTLAEVTDQVKDATRRLNAIAVDAAGGVRGRVAMYRIEQPVQVTTVRSFGARKAVTWVLGAMVLAPLAFAFVLIAQVHLRRLAKKMERRRPE